MIRQSCHIGLNKRLCAYRIVYRPLIQVVLGMKLYKFILNIFYHGLVVGYDSLGDSIINCLKPQLKGSFCGYFGKFLKRSLNPRLKLLNPRLFILCSELDEFPLRCYLRLTSCSDRRIRTRPCKYLCSPCAVPLAHSRLNKCLPLIFGQP